MYCWLAQLIDSSKNNSLYDSEELNDRRTTMEVRMFANGSHRECFLGRRCRSVGGTNVMRSYDNLW